MTIQHPTVTIRRALGILSSDAQVSLAASRVLEEVWPTFKPEQHKLLLGTHDTANMERIRDELSELVSSDLVSLGESAPEMMPGERCWRREAKEPPSRSHLVLLLDMLDFLNIFVGEDGKSEIAMKEGGPAT